MRKLEIISKLVYLQEVHIKLLNDRVCTLEVTLSHSQSEARKLSENLKAIHDNKGDD